MKSIEEEALAYGGAIYWYDQETEAWFRYEKDVWRSEKIEKAAQWRPWTKLIDTSRHPYISWFQGAKSNMTYSALDCHVNQGYGQDIAFECLHHNVSTGQEDVIKMNRLELLTAVEYVAGKLQRACGTQTHLERCVFHCRVKLEHFVYVLACARLAIVYSCTALDITDGSLEYRVDNFSPTFGVASPDNLQEAVASRLRTCLRQNQDMFIIDAHSIHPDTQQVDRVLPMAVSDYRPLCVVYTSGSTGKPKGIVHGHCGYAACVSRSMHHVFSIKREDRFMAIATLAWITGQSYMLTGPLLAGCTSIIIQGSALGTDGLRWARIARDFNVSILKAASAFVRHSKVSEERSRALKEINLLHTLRMATFCAEPVSPDVQSWACKVVCRAFINSYWATEHGSIIMSRPLNFQINSYIPDTKCWPVPWVYAELSQAHLANRSEEKLHDIVLTKPYAGLVRTVWGDLEHYTNEDWRGDESRLAKSYFPFKKSNSHQSHSYQEIDYGFVQGDAARLDPHDHGWTFHGRSDEVLNVAGVRVGVGEIEHVLWSLKIPETDSVRLSELAVVGGPDEVKGEVPIVFALFEKNGDATLNDIDSVLEMYLNKWREVARHQLGAHAEASAVLPCLGLPKTVTGKISRELLRRALRGILTSADDVQRSVVNGFAYWDCVRAAYIWRRERALLTSVDLEVQSSWSELDFDGHVIDGEPLLPATGWLAIFRRRFYLDQECVHLSSVEYMKGTRRSNISQSTFVARKETTNQISVGIAQDDPAIYVRAKFVSGLPPQEDTTCLRLAEEATIVDDYGVDVHERRCSSVLLDYSGAFRCVRRVIWKSNGIALIDVVARNSAALIDSGLQVLCSVDTLSNRRSMIPYAITSFALLRPEKFYFKHDENCPKRWLVIAEIVSRRSTSLVANVYYYRWERGSLNRVISQEKPVAVMRGVSISQFESSSKSTTPVEKEVNDQVSTTSKAAQNGTLGSEESDVLDALVKVGSEIVGNKLDPEKSLFENGLHSLRIVEFVTQLKSIHNIQLSPRDFVSVHTFADLSRMIKQRYQDRSKPQERRVKNGDRFASIDFGALERIFATFHTNSIAEHVGEKASQQGSNEVFRAVFYMLRRGFFRYMRIQYQDGLFDFFLRPPLRLNLYAIAIVSGPRVTFSQTDYNRHFTVREIVRDSERGFYNLLHRTGLAYLEHYYRVMFFASRLDARFDLELLEGQRYYMRSHISSINGPLLDIHVAFHNGETGMRAFVVQWRLMLVVDAEAKRMYDFEIGGAFASENPSSEQNSSSSTPRAIAHSKMKSAANTKKSQRTNRISLVNVVLLVSFLVFVGPFLWSSFFVEEEESQPHHSSSSVTDSVTKSIPPQQYYNMSP